VAPPWYALLFGLAVFGLGLLAFLAAAAVFARQAVGGDDPVRSAGYAAFLLFAAAGCGRGAWYFYLKLRAAPAADEPTE